MVAWNSHIIIFGLREVSLMAISYVYYLFFKGHMELAKVVMLLCEELLLMARFNQQKTWV